MASGVEDEADERTVVLRPRFTGGTRCVITVKRGARVVVEVVAPGLAADVHLPRDDVAGLPAFVAGIAEQVAGWDGPARWRSVDGDVRIDATWRPGTWTNEGLVRLGILLAPHRLRMWEVRADVVVDAAAGAQLQTWAADLATAFEVGRIASAQARYADPGGFVPDLPQVVEFIPENDWCWWVVSIEGSVDQQLLEELFGGCERGRPVDPALSWEQVRELAGRVHQCQDLLLVATTARYDLVPEEVERDDFSRCVFALRCVDSGETTVFVSTDVPGWERLLESVRSI